MFRYLDDVLSLNNSKLGDFVDRVYLTERKIKDTTDTVRSASYLDYTSKLQWMLIKNETLRQTKWLKYFHCESSIYK
jgi:hypothetical protein